MSIAREVFSRIRDIYLQTTQQHRSNVIENINSVWRQFIFKDVKKAKDLKTKGYDFTLLGQDIYDRGVNSELPTGHYSYYLFITYKGKYINPFNHINELKKVLYGELINDYTHIFGCPIIYTSVYRRSMSANIFICIHESNKSNDILKINNTVGDSLLYIYMNIPYLRFDSDQPIRFSKRKTNNIDNTNEENIFTIQFETYINGLDFDIISYDFVI